MDMRPPTLKEIARILHNTFTGGLPPMGFALYVDVIDPVTLRMMQERGLPAPQEFGSSTKLPPEVEAARGTLRKIFKEVDDLHRTDGEDEEAYAESRDDLIAWWADNVSKTEARAFNAANPSRSPDIGMAPPTPERERRMASALGEGALRAHIRRYLRG